MSSRPGPRRPRPGARWYRGDAAGGGDLCHGELAGVVHPLGFADEAGGQFPECAADGGPGSHQSLWRQGDSCCAGSGPEWSKQVADTPGDLRSGSADGRHHCSHGSVRSAARETSARQLSFICCRVRAELSAGGQSPARRSRQACHGCPCDGLQCLGTAAATRRTNAGRCDRRPNLVRNSNPAGAYRLAS